MRFDIPPITLPEVFEFIRKLDPVKATGLDGVGPRILKLAAEILSPIIVVLINKILNTGQFSNQLKMAKVFPIFKSGQKTDPSNYRPISILSTLAEICEKHVNKHTMCYLNKHKLIYECQSGFRHKHSCQTALVKLVDQWINCADQGDIVDYVYRLSYDLLHGRSLSPNKQTFFL